jgi:predicted CXXCH cytochrome family protein
MMPVLSKARRANAVVQLSRNYAWWLFPVLLTSITALSQPTSVREADAQCASCHADIYRKYLATPMANASGLAAEQLHTDTFTHKPSGVEYKISLQDGRASLIYHGPHESSSANQLPLNYFLGSGHLGTTYLYSVNNYLFESPVAWYAASQSYDMKPGLADMHQAPPPLPMQSRCLRCHMSSVQASDSGTINRYQGLPFLHSGITCESCHGDSQQHVLTKGKAKIVNPARLDAARRDSICISCHLEGDVSVERAGRSVLNYRPGESISNYLTYYVRTGANLTARGVSEVEQLSQSTCKRMSGDTMSCSSCHDPHFTPNAEQRTAFFRSKCLACHSQPEFAKLHHPENQDCTSCHMGRVGAGNILHVAWTDHRILKVPERPKAESHVKAENDLVPIFSPEATDRDLAMAYYQELLEGDRSAEATAWEQLKKQQGSIANDKEALDALGNLSAERGDHNAAEKAFRRVLELEPTNLTALSNLGTLLAKEGKLSDAIPLLRTAFDRNQDVAGLAMNLARVQCMAGDGPAARNTLSAALLYCPNYEDMRRLLTQMSACNGVTSR